uniref:N-acetylgalactosaminide beta-1,3-galactosyltransferase n=1 Tax=Timspurckia oligopyrenoides TaxID=708627 RepID=A0A7S1EPZ3_9RHOD|mmetsp:Transcript_11044/g.19971  ORF Transcript_11044/g.19971 Transcript_11044/m.19971 type:complete len:402 (+) Transcript_11044:171-1376(+)
MIISLKFRHVFPCVVPFLLILVLTSISLPFIHSRNPYLSKHYDSSTVDIDFQKGIELNSTYFNTNYKAKSLDLLIAVTTKHPIVNDLSILKSSLETWASGSNFNSADRFMIYSGSSSNVSKSFIHQPALNSRSVTLRQISWKYSSLNPSLSSILSKVPLSSMLRNVYKKPTETNQQFPLFWVELKVVRDSDYPALNKNLLQWEHMSQLTAFKWYLRCDDDAYVNVKLYRELLLKLDHNKPYYIGKGGYGRAQEVDLLRIESKKYALGGFCQVFSAGAQEMVRNCRKSVKKWRQVLGRNHTHDDVEFGRCMHDQGLSLDELGLPVIEAFVHVGNPVKKTQPMTTISDKVLRWKLTRKKVQCPLVVHPVKSPYKMHFIHHLVEQVQLEDHCQLHSGNHSLLGF